MKDNRWLYNKEYFRTSKNFQSDMRRINTFVDLISWFQPKNVLDVGCGLGTLVLELNKLGINAIGMDFAPTLREDYWKDEHFMIGDARKIAFPDNAFDVVFSSDFFEHIDEEDIETVANEMKRVGTTVIAFIADDFNGKPLNQHQRLRHVTHKPLDWWKEKLKDIQVYSSHYNA